MDTILTTRPYVTQEMARVEDGTRVGIIGCGYWGPNLIRNFYESPKSNLVAVSDLKPERLRFVQKTYPLVRTFSDYHELFDLNLDAIVVATPPMTHYSIAREVIESGHHVMIEKPMTLQSEHARDLIQLAKEHERVLMVGHAFEYNQAVQKLKNIIDQGEIGAIHYIDCARLNLGLYQSGVNVLWDLAPHDVSILCYILGMEPLWVTAQGARCIRNDIYDVVYMNLMFPDNIMAHVHVSWLDPCKVRRVTVVGSKKMVIFNDVENDKIKIIDKGVFSPTASATFADFQYSYRNGDILIPSMRLVEPLRLETEHFVDCIVNQTSPATNGEDGLRVVKVLEAAQRSLENHAREEGIEYG